MMKASFVAAAVLVGLWASAANCGPITDAQLASLKVGATTYADVVAQFGKPFAVEASSDGSKTLTYMTSKTHIKGASFIPVIGLFAGGAKGDTTTERFEFGPDGVLTKTWTSETHVDCKTFGGCDSK